MRVMPISDSPFAPTGFGSVTKNVSAILTHAGHQIGYLGCQNLPHIPPYFDMEWPLHSKQQLRFSMINLKYPGEEKFGEKTFPHALQEFRPDIVLTHLDVQMMIYVAMMKKPTDIQVHLRGPTGEFMDQKSLESLFTNALKQRMKGPDWKWASILPVDGQPLPENWEPVLNEVDSILAMAKYGQTALKDQFGKESTYMPHGVNTQFFKPREVDREEFFSASFDAPDNDTFIVGLVARNQHRKMIPRMMFAFKLFIKNKNLKPHQTRFLFHGDWTDQMGWDIKYMSRLYGIEDYMVPPSMMSLDVSATEDEMVDVYNMMDVYASPTGGEGFGVPHIEAMSCGLPTLLPNYTTSYEQILADKPECPVEELFSREKKIRWSNRGGLIPIKDFFWDVPKKAAVLRGLIEEHELAQAFEFYYDNPKTVKEHGRNAHNFAIKHYDWTPVGERWIKWIKTME